MIYHMHEPDTWYKSLVDQTSQSLLTVAHDDVSVM